MRFGRTVRTSYSLPLRIVKVLLKAMLPSLLPEAPPRLATGRLVALHVRLPQPGAHPRVARTCLIKEMSQSQEG